MKKNIKVCILKLLDFGGEIFNIYEQAGFRNDFAFLIDPIIYIFFLHIPKEFLCLVSKALSYDLTATATCY